VIEGTVLDVAVDLRKGSPTFGKYMAVELSGQNKRQFYIPQGFAHGFHVLSERAVFTYKVDNPYMPSHERSLRFDDPQIGIDWQITDPENVILSEKDKTAPLLAEADINYIY
jgi:dTDP-4-dehydrorhamnose 3,5-epimerase